MQVKSCTMSGSVHHIDSSDQDSFLIARPSLKVAESTSQTSQRTFQSTEPERFTAQAKPRNVRQWGGAAAEGCRP